VSKKFDFFKKSDFWQTGKEFGLEILGVSHFFDEVFSQKGHQSNRVNQFDNLAPNRWAMALCQRNPIF
jgi:hypothetical protein